VYIKNHFFSTTIMGLSERRAVQSLKEKGIKVFENEATSVCGFNVAVDADWPSLENHQDCIWIIENLKPQTEWFDKVKAALKAICADDLGKSSLKDKLTKIYFINASGELSLEAGTFTIHSALDGSGVWGAEEIQNYLEKQL